MASPEAGQAAIASGGGPDSVRWSAAVATVFLCVVVVSILNHEMWRDELQAWMLARDSGSFLELIRNMRYEGHPAAWHTILFGLSRVTRDPLAMQLLHLGLATGVAFAICRFAPLPRLEKVLLVFGYFFFYEYAVLSRAYALGNLALVGFCAAFPSRRRSYLPLALLLALLANTSIYGTMLAMALGATLLFEWLWDPELVKSLARRRVRVAASIAIVLAGIALGLLQVQPPPDAVFAPSAGAASVVAVPAAEWTWEAATAAARLWQAYVPIPDLASGHWWETNVVGFDGTSFPLKLALVFSALLGAASLVLFRRKPIVLFLYVVGTSGMLFFSYRYFPGGLRHAGHLFLLFVVCLWLAALSTPSWPGRSSPGSPRARVARWFVLALLTAQVVSALLLHGRDLVRPFSPAKATAEWLRENEFADAPIVGTPGAPASAVAGYLDRQIYYPQTSGLGTFVRWDLYKQVGEDTEVEIMSGLLADGAPELILISEGPLRDPGGLAVSELVYFPAAEEQTEEYHVYRVTNR